MSVDHAATAAVLRALSARVDDRTSVGIASALACHIRSGAVGPGQRLPTVREVARELRVSPVTVTGAWQSLAGLGVIVPRGRAGTFVADTIRPRGRYARLHPYSGPTPTIDLASGTPDPALLPDLSAALASVAGNDLAANYPGEPVLPDLADLMRRLWPFEPERLAVTDGALDAIDRLIALGIHHGDRVIVEENCFPPFLDMIAEAGARPIPVCMDELGPIPADLAAVIDTHAPAAVLLQTRAHNPTGASLAPERLPDLAAALTAGTAVPLIIEDDHSGDISTSPDLSLGSLLPEHVVHVRSYSKSHGADLRLAVVGGPAGIVDPLVQRRMLGPGWTSRLLQRILLAMLTDPAAQAVVAGARDRYRARSAAVRSALVDHDIDLPAADGFNLWIPVRDQSAAMVCLAAAGIAVAPGEVFRVGADDDVDHLRATVSTLAGDDVGWVTEELVRAAEAEPMYGRRR